MYIVLQGMSETEEPGLIKQQGLGKIINGMVCQVVTFAPVIFKDVTEQGVFLTEAQVAEIVQYGMSDSLTSRLLVDFHKKQPVVESNKVADRINFPVDNPDVSNYTGVQLRPKDAIHLLNGNFEKFDPADELSSLEMAAEQNKPLSVEEVRNLKRDAERKIDDILETLCKELGPRSHIEVVTFDFDEMQRIIAGKRYNTKIKVFIS